MIKKLALVDIGIEIETTKPLNNIEIKDLLQLNISEALEKLQEDYGNGMKEKITGFSIHQIKISDL